MEPSTNPVTLTPEAKDKVKELMSEGDNLRLRIWVEGGGCAGLSYGMGLDDATDEEDITFAEDGIPMAVDAASLEYLQGAVVEYDDNVLGGGFRINNPNAKGGCGCGNSFKAEGDTAPTSGCGGCQNA